MMPILAHGRDVSLIYLQIRVAKVPQIHPVDQLLGIKWSLLLALRVNVMPG